MTKYTIDSSKVKALLFDWDGTLVDTEIYQHKAYVKAFKKYGLKYPNYKVHCNIYTGNPTDVIFSKFMKDKTTKITLNKFATERRKIYYQEIKKGVRSKKGAGQLLTKAKNKGLKLVIITGNRHDMLKRVLSLSNLTDVFSLKITAEKYKKPRPNPQSLFLATKKLKLKPSQCLFFEDAINGIKAAKAAKMDYFVVAGVVPEKEFKAIDNKIKVIKDFTQIKIV